EVQSAGSCEPDDACLCGAVCGEINRSDQAGHRRQIHNSSVAPLRHLACRQLHAKERPRQIYVQLSLPILGSDLQERGAFLDSCVVDEDVQTAKLANDLGDCCLDRVEVRDVRNGHQSVAPDASNIFRGRLCLLAVDIDDADVVPFAGNTCGDGLADSLAGSSNDGDLSLKSHFPSSSPAASDPIL